MIRNEEETRRSSTVDVAQWFVRATGVLALAGSACGASSGGGDATSGTSTTGSDTTGSTTTSSAGAGGESGAGGAEPGTTSGSGAGPGGSSAGSGGTADCEGNPGGADKSPSVDLLEGVVVTTFAGSGTAGTADGAAGVATFSNPVNVIIDGSGVLIAEFDAGRIRHAAAQGGITTLTQQEDFTRPFGLALSDDTLFVETDEDDAGPEGGAIWSVSLSSGQATLLTDQAGRPRGMALLTTGELVVADVAASVLRVVDVDAGTFADLAGVAECPGYRDGAGAAARFDKPMGMAATSDGDVLVADMGNHVIRRITRGGDVSTFAGDGVAGMIDGEASEARFNGPKSIAIDANGNVYVSDVGNHRIRRIRTDGVVETLAGTGTAGFADGGGGEARFFGQEGLDVTPDGATIYVADGTDGIEGEPYHRIRKISLP